MELHLDSVRNTVIKQGTRVTDIAEHVTNANSKWAGHIARMKDK